MERLPGLFHLDLNASQETNSKNLSYRIKSMKKLKRDIPGKFTFSAASNLLGVFLFYNRRIGEAIQEFKTVLSLDEHNINALENLIFVYQRLQMSQVSQSYEQKKNDLEITDTARAIHLSEQGFAYRFDCHVEKDELDRCQRSADLYHESLKLLSEKNLEVEINFWLILCLQQKFNACVRRGDDEGKWNCYNEGIRLIKANIDTLKESCESVQEQTIGNGCSNTNVFPQGASGFPNVQGNLDTAKPLLESEQDHALGSECSKTDVLPSEESGLSNVQDNSKLNIDVVKQPHESEKEQEIFQSEHEKTIGSECSNTDVLPHGESHLPNVQASMEETKTGIYKSEREGVNSPSLTQGRADISECSCHGDKYWRAMTLTYLGIYLSKHPKSYWDETGKLVIVHELSDVVKDCGFDCYFSDPESCFKEAVELMDTIQCDNEHHGDGSECRIRYAIFLRNRNESLDTAVTLLDKVISRDNTASDWFAMTARSQINEKRSRQANTNGDQELAKQLLENAIQDAEECKIIQQSASEFARTGALYHFKAKYYDSPEEKELSKLKASENFLYAVQSIGEEKRPEIHRMHGTFFNAFGEHRQAIECFKRGIASDTTERETFTFKIMFETFLNMNKKGDDSKDMNNSNSNEVDSDQTVEFETDDNLSEAGLSQSDNVATDHSPVVQHQNVLYEMVYWFKFAYERYGKAVENHLNDGKHQRNKTMSDMKKIVKKFTSDHKREMSDIAAYFKVALGQTVICDYITDCSDGGDEWGEMIRESTEKWTNKHPHTPTKITTQPCPFCGNSNPNLPRQISVFPGSHAKARNLIYQYDFCIIYSTKDEDWVLYYLLTGLETTYGFKGAVAERDFNPGCLILSEINRLCDQSYKVLLILSDNFITDPMCSYGMTQAMTKRIQKNGRRDENYIIPIMKSRCAVPAQVETLHTLNATPDLDWEKLALSLESKL